LACVAAIAAWNHFQEANERRVADLLGEVASTKDQLLGFNKYTDYLSAGQQTLVEQTKLLTASVRRSYRLARKVEAGLMGVPVSSGAVVVDYEVEYSFGYELKRNTFEVRNTKRGIELWLPRPSMVAPPAVSGLQREVLARGLITDEKGAVLNAYEEAAKNAQKMGLEMATRPEVVALCEKMVISFFRDFLAKQPGVKTIPSIAVVYND
jgi:hypothetical protein